MLALYPISSSLTLASVSARDSWRMRRNEFSAKQTHHYVIVPMSVNKCRLTFTTFDDKPALLIGSDGPRIVGKHANSDPMKLHRPERVIQQQHDRFGTEAAPERRRIVDAYRHRGSTILRINSIQSDLADKHPSGFNNPGMGMLNELLHPSRCAFHRYWSHVLSTDPEHLDNFWIVSQSKSSLGVGYTGYAKSDVLSFQARSYTQGFRSRIIPLSNLSHVDDGPDQPIRPQARVFDDNLAPLDPSVFPGGFSC